MAENIIELNKAAVVNAEDVSKALYGCGTYDPTVEPEYRLNLGHLVDGLYDLLGAVISDSTAMASLYEIDLDVPVEMSDNFKDTWIDVWGEEMVQQFISDLYERFAMTPEEIFGVTKTEE